MGDFTHEAHKLIEHHRDEMEKFASQYQNSEKEWARFKYAVDNYQNMSGQLLHLSNVVFNTGGQDAEFEREKSAVMNECYYTFLENARFKD